MGELIEELEKTISLLEATIPANPGGPKGQRLESQLEGDVARYFRALGQAIPLDKVENLYYSLVAQE